MTNTERFYKAALNFQNDRAATVTAYERKMQELEKHKGSEFYDEESKKAADAQKFKLDSLRQEYGKEMFEALAAMDEVNNRRGIPAPTTDELNIISAMKMRENITEPELDRIAKSLHSEQCLAIVQETARKFGYIGHNYMKYAASDGLPVATVNSHLQNAKDSLNDFMQFDTARAARVAQRHHEINYGLTGNERPLAKRKLFETKEQCFSDLLGVADMDGFSAAVDGKEGI